MPFVQRGASPWPKADTAWLRMEQPTTPTSYARLQALSGVAGDIRLLSPFANSDEFGNGVAQQPADARAVAVVQ
jgi:hypothetical protein